MIVTMYMKLNDENSHLMKTEHECYVIQTKKSKANNWENKKQELLGAVIDQELKFASARPAKFLTLNQRGVPEKNGAGYLFGYCSLV